MHRGPAAGALTPVPARLGALTAYGGIVYSRIKIAGHPVHPMLVAFPVASYTGTLVGYAVYAANGHQFWLNLAIALNLIGVCAAALAVLPGLAD